VTDGARLRLTVDGPLPLVVQLGPDEIGRFEPARRGEVVHEIESSVADRRAGRRRFEVVVDGWRFEVTTESALRATLRQRAVRAAAEQSGATSTVVRAQMPGRVVRLWVADGQAVESGARLLAIEAMKMENEVRALKRGIVSRLRVQLGSRVERDDELLTIDSAEVNVDSQS
jgi:biotin carboxyl carrier protein